MKSRYYFDVHTSKSVDIFLIFCKSTVTVESGICVGQEISVAPGKFDKKNNRRPWKM